MSKLCKPVADEDRRDPIMRFRVNAAERKEIEQQAAIRGLDLSKYVRRCLLHRRADVRIEIDMILAVRDVVAEIKALHKAYLAAGHPPPEKQLGQVLQHAIRAIQNLERY